MLDFLPAFDSSAVERMERNAQENATRAAVYRRLSFALLTKSSAELRAAVAETETAEVFLSNAECLGEAIKWHEAQIELLHTAEARIFAALSDTFPEAVEEEQPGAAVLDKAQAGVSFPTMVRKMSRRLTTILDREAPSRQPAR
jgi:hypothetical protein